MYLNSSNHQALRHDRTYNTRYQDSSESDLPQDTSHLQEQYERRQLAYKMIDQSKESHETTQNQDTYQNQSDEEEIQRVDSLQQTQKYFSLINHGSGQIGYRRQSTDYVQRQQKELLDVSKMPRQNQNENELEISGIEPGIQTQNQQQQMALDTRNVSHYTSFSQQVINPQPVLQSSSQQFSNKYGSEGAFSASTKMDQNYDFLISPNYAQSEEDFSSQHNHQKQALHQSQPISFQNLNIQPGSEQPFNIQGSAGSNNYYKHTNYHLDSHFKGQNEFTLDKQDQLRYMPEFNSKRDTQQTARISQEFQIEECPDSFANKNEIQINQCKDQLRQSDQRIYEYQPVYSYKNSQREYEYINEEYGKRQKALQSQMYHNHEKASEDISETFESGESQNPHNYQFKKNWAFENRENHNLNMKEVQMNISAISPQTSIPGLSNDHSELIIAQQLERASNKSNRNLFTKSPGSTIQTLQAFKHNLEFEQTLENPKQSQPYETFNQRKPLSDLTIETRKYEELNQKQIATLELQSQPLFENKHKYFYNPYETNTLTQELKTIVSCKEDPKPYVALRSNHLNTIQKQEEEIQSQIKGFMNEAKIMEKDLQKLQNCQSKSSTCKTLQPKEPNFNNFGADISYLDTSTFSQMNAENERMNKSEISRLNFKQLVQPQSFVSLPDTKKAQSTLSQGDSHQCRTGYFNGRSHSQKPSHPPPKQNENNKKPFGSNDLVIYSDKGQDNYRKNENLRKRDFEVRTLGSEYQGYGSSKGFEVNQNRTIISDGGVQQRREIHRSSSNNEKRGRGAIFTPEIISKSLERTKLQRKDQSPQEISSQRQVDLDQSQVPYQNMEHSKDQVQDTDQYSYIDTTEISMIEQAPSQNRSFDINRKIESIFTKGFEALGIDCQNQLCRDPLEKALELIGLLTQELFKNKQDFGKLKEDEFVSKQLTLGLNENLSQAMRNSERLSRKYKRAKNKIAQIKAEMSKLQSQLNFPQSRFQSQIIPFGQLNSLQGIDANGRSNLTSLNANFEKQGTNNINYQQKNTSFQRTEGSSSYQNLYNKFNSYVPKHPKKSKSQQRKQNKVSHAIDSDIDHSDLLSQQAAAPVSLTEQNDTIVQLQFELDEKESVVKQHEKKIRSLIVDNETLIDEGLLKDKLIAVTQSQVINLQQSINELQNLRIKLEEQLHSQGQQLQDNERSLSRYNKDLKRAKEKSQKASDEYLIKQEDYERRIAQLQDELNALRLESIERDDLKGKEVIIPTEKSTDDFQLAKNDFFNHFCEMFKQNEQGLFSGEIFSLVCHLHFIFENFTTLDQEVQRLHTLRQKIVNIILSIESSDKQMGLTTTQNLNTTLNAGSIDNPSDNSLSKGYSIPVSQDHDQSMPMHAYNDSSDHPIKRQGQNSQVAKQESSYNHSSQPSSQLQSESFNLQEKYKQSRGQSTLTDQSLLIKLQELKSLYFDNEELKFVASQLKHLLHLKPQSKEIDVLDEIQNLLHDNQRLSKKLDQVVKESKSMKQLVDFYVKANSLDVVLWTETKETEESRGSKAEKRKSSKNRKRENSKGGSKTYDDGIIMQIREHIQWQCNELLNFCDVCQIARKDLFLDPNLSNYEVLLCLKEFVIRQQDSLRSLQPYSQQIPNYK